jgi:nicotinamide-nucleotide amidase
MLAAEILHNLAAKGLKLAVAESLTGGLLASAIVDVPGASKVFLGGVVAYDSNLKQSLLHVSSSLLQSRGAVDAEVAVAMARGVRVLGAEAAHLSIGEVIGVATTGVAGPESQDGKPAGLVYLAISGLGDLEAIELRLEGDRQQIREATVSAALEELAARI